MLNLVEKEVCDRFRQWVTAGFEGRSEGQADVEHDLAIFTYPGARRLTKTDHLAAISQTATVKEHDVTAFRCEVFHHALAIVWWEHTLRAELADDPFDDPAQLALFRDGALFACTTVWARCEDQKWRVASQDACLV